ncbi:hypothetical protein, partial [Xanthomonas vasicola]
QRHNANQGRGALQERPLKNIDFIAQEIVDQREKMRKCRAIFSALAHKKMAPTVPGPSIKPYLSLQRRTIT